MVVVVMLMMAVVVVAAVVVAEAVGTSTMDFIDRANVC